jgi:hypothetical protein
MKSGLSRFVARVLGVFGGTRAEGRPMVEGPPANHHRQRGRTYDRGWDPWAGLPSVEGRPPSRQRERARGRRLAFAAITEQRPGTPRRERRTYAREAFRWAAYARASESFQGMQ